MKTIELIERIEEAVNKHINVKSINVEATMRNKGEDNHVYVVVYYSAKNSEVSNFTVSTNATPSFHFKPQSLINAAKAKAIEVTEPRSYEVLEL